MNTRVLVVDDEPLIAENLQAFLEDERMAVTCVSSAEEALDLVQAGNAFDLCIMDMRLPGMDGDSAIQALHQIDPELQFIIHTGSLDYALTTEIERLGIGETQLFKKPLADMAPLAATIRELARAEPR